MVAVTLLMGLPTGPGSGLIGGVETIAGAPLNTRGAAGVFASDLVLGDAWRELDQLSGPLAERPEPRPRRWRARSRRGRRGR